MMNVEREGGREGEGVQWREFTEDKNRSERNEEKKERERAKANTGSCSRTRGRTRQRSPGSSRSSSSEPSSLCCTCFTLGTPATPPPARGGEGGLIPPANQLQA